MPSWNTVIAVVTGWAWSTEGIADRWPNCHHRGWPACHWRWVRPHSHTIIHLPENVRYQVHVLHCAEAPNNEILFHTINLIMAISIWLIIINNYVELHLCKYSTPLEIAVIMKNIQSSYTYLTIITGQAHNIMTVIVRGDFKMHSGIMHVWKICLSERWHRTLKK